MSAQIEWAEPGDAKAVADRIAAAVAEPGRKWLAVPGGSTPAKVFAELAVRGLDWSDCEVWLTDDRQVPHDHPASNYGKLAAALGPTEATLAGLSEGAVPPPFDLVWLGMGADGHIASLFPEMAAGERAGPHVIATVPEPLPPEAPFSRLSLNLEALVAADAIILVVTGRDKRLVLEEAIAGRVQHLPVAQLLRAARCPVTIYWSE